MKYLSKIVAVGLVSVLLSGCITEYKTFPRACSPHKSVVVTRGLHHRHHPRVFLHKHFVPHQHRRHANVVVTKVVKADPRVVVTKVAKADPRVVVTKHKKVKRAEQQPKVVVITKHL